MKWKQISLGEILHVKHGWAFKSECFSDTGENIVLTPGNFYEEGGFKLRGGKDRFYSGDYPSEYLLSKGSVIVAMTEQGEGLLGSTALIPEDNRYLHNQRLGLVTIKDTAHADLFFVYKLFNTQMVRQQISGSASGAKVKHTAPERIYKCKVHLPPIQIQQKIAVILSAYDDLIENNLKRIKLLEEMTQITYEEWFVRLKFPGHETTSMDSETGLPIGWNNTKLGNYIKFHKGKKLDEIFDNQVPDSSKILLLDSLENGVYKYALSKGHVKAIRGDLIMLMDGARSSWVFFAENGIVGSTISKITSEKIPLTLLYQFFKCHLEWLQINNTGAAIPHANKQFINRINFKLASDDVLNLWRKTIDPIYQCIWKLKDQNQLLKEARDLLLPRLMTGMIDIEQLVLPEPFSNTPSSPEQQPQAA